MNAGLTIGTNMLSAATWNTRDLAVQLLPNVPHAERLPEELTTP
jgi:hypothetical protein